MTAPIKNQSIIEPVELVVPIVIDGNEIKTLDIQKPNSGNLRGLSLVDVCDMRFEAGQVLLPRISNLNERDAINMPVENWAPILTTIASFFVDVEH
ncbi:phage tail assembly protein [Vibrio coralliilyticus]|uniref:phage tail assembly protein n=1 Tax=Vibrio coralliilyticus TaxID=190893 RepID=UPI00148C20A4|nr:phage tail assembly protein [Vibrio coralliilyticus]NOI32184.1 phage tail assembly protein [Vibrio coralliilyticus]NOI51350.1 phage tail assembly protein [Vibrio coralliilyticus]